MRTEKDNISHTHTGKKAGKFHVSYKRLHTTMKPISAAQGPGESMAGVEKELFFHASSPSVAWELKRPSQKLLCSTGCHFNRGFLQKSQNKVTRCCE